jgi:hypothetical protein
MKLLRPEYVILDPFHRSLLPLLGEGLDEGYNKAGLTVAATGVMSEE